MLAFLRPSGVRQPLGPARSIVLSTAIALGLGGCYQGLDEGNRGAGGVGGGGVDDGGDDGGNTGGDDGDDGDTGGGGGGDGGDGGDGNTGDDGGGGTGGDGGGNTGDDGGGNTGDDGGTPGDDGGGGNDPEVPDNSYCQPVSGWQAAWSQKEQDVLDIVNQYRAQGASCGSYGSFGATHPLTMQPNLRCAARVHSKDMNDRNFFDHTNPSGEDPFDRIQKAGYNMITGGENIAGGSPDAAGTMQQWMGSDGHCRNIMSPDYTEIGVGYYPGGQWGHLWTQAFGRPQ